MLFKNYIRNLIIFLLSILHICNAEAEPKVTFTYKTFSISGNNIAELKRSVNENAPKNDSIYSFSPFTNYEIGTTSLTNPLTLVK